MSTMESPAVSELLARVSELEHRLGTLEDVRAIERLQHQYGYYLDKCYYDEVVDLFTDDEPEVQFLHGVFKGKEGVRRLYSGRFKQRFAGGTNGPVPARLLDHPQLQPVITVAADRGSALGRFRTLMQAGNHNTHESPRQWWEGGIYENSYVREDGQWKLKVLDFRQVWQADYDQGWMRTSDYTDYLATTYPEDPYGPDEIRATWRMFPATETVPFHYPHPITGRDVSA
jgi:SnoaL-like domain